MSFQSSKVERHGNKTTPFNWSSAGVNTTFRNNVLGQQIAIAER